MKKEQDIKYFMYVRKSTESKERQYLSIPAQVRKLKEQFGHLDIEIIEEQKSAFKPYNRPLFSSVLERIHNGERTGLIAWHPDRLSRNEKDAGEITYMVRMGGIEDLKFGTYHFENTPEGIWMLQNALSQSQYESAKKGRDVKRGLYEKARMGIYPAPAPLGYLNDKSTVPKSIITDPERFHLCRKIVDMMLTGNYTPPQILKIATEDWGMKGPRGKNISRSNIYRLFHHPFYYGEFEYPEGSGKWHKGTHEPLITKDEYDRIQMIISGKNTQQRPKALDFAYRGPIRCGECGAMVTAENKVKKQKNGNVHGYVYYHCTKRVDPKCSQKSISETKLEKQIEQTLSEIEIPPEFAKWALNELKYMNETEVTDREKTQLGQQNEYNRCVRKLDNLIEMRMNGELEEDEFLSRKRSLQQEKDKYTELMNDTDERIDNWLSIAEDYINFAETAHIAFKQGTPEEKKEIFAALGSNLLLKDQKLRIDWVNQLFPMKRLAGEVQALHSTFEPVKTPIGYEELAQMYANSPRVLLDRDSNPD